MFVNDLYHHHDLVEGTLLDLKVEIKNSCKVVLVLDVTMFVVVIVTVLVLRVVCVLNMLPNVDSAKFLKAMVR